MDIEDYKADVEKSIEVLRKKVVDQITLESEKLIQELLDIIYDREVDSRVRLSAIGMLLDRGIPKLGVEHTKDEEVEESNSRKKMRSEIEELIKKGQ